MWRLSVAFSCNRRKILVSGHCGESTRPVGLVTFSSLMSLSSAVVCDWDPVVCIVNAAGLGLVWRQGKSGDVKGPAKKSY